MSIEIDFQEKEGYFQATVTGKFTKDGALPLFEKLLLYSAVTKQSKVLIDCRGIEADMSMTELLAYSLKTAEIVDDYSSSGRIKDLRSAYLFHEDMHDPDQILENIDPNSSEDFIITTNFDEAMKWIQSM